MNHKIYFYNPYIILKIFISCTDEYDSLPSKPEVEYLKKFISHEPQKIYLQSLHHLKDLSLYYISYTDMTHNLASPSGRKRTFT